MGFTRALVVCWFACLTAACGGESFQQTLATVSQDFTDLVDAQTAVSGGQHANGSELLIFGGRGHDTFLGCLNCSEFDTNSVHNEFGAGSAFKSESIFNEFGPFGSEFSTFSACSPYASDPPVVVDGEGNFYGRLTVNEFGQNAIKDESIVAWLKGEVCKR